MYNKINRRTIITVLILNVRSVLTVYGNELKG